MELEEIIGTGFDFPETAREYMMTFDTDEFYRRTCELYDEFIEIPDRYKVSKL